MLSDTREEASPNISDGRSPSPGEKRPASEITDSDPEGGVSTANTGIARSTGNTPTDEITYPTPSTSGNKTDFSSPSREQSDSETANSDGPPAIDDQVAEVNTLMDEPKKDGQKGYVVSMTWLKKVLARTTSHADHSTDSTEGNIGPVDNLDIILDTDPAATGFKDETGGAFVALRPGLQEAADFVIVPQKGWQLIEKWYGLAESSQPIVRYAHNVSQPGDAAKIEYEAYPPILSILKLLNPSAGTTPTTLKEKNLPSAKILTSRQTAFQKWLKEAKEKSGIDISTKVRVWKILQLPRSTTTSTAVTPATSRAASPAPPSALIPNTADRLLLDLNVFLGLSEGTHRVLLEHVKDETNNPKYNGRMSLDIAGLGSADCVVLEEQVGGLKAGEWISEASTRTLKRLGIPVELKLENKPTLALGNSSPPASGRSTPASVAPTLFGRGRKGRKPRVVGLENLGNTCYMNSALQCVRSIEELTYYFLSGKYKSELNPGNKLGCGGDVAKQWANLLTELYNPDAMHYVSPNRLRRAAGRQRSEFGGFEQHDSQEFVMFLLDALSEDLSRIGQKPYTTIPDSTDEMVKDRKALEEFGKTCWDLYESRNASVITDLFSGMYKSTLICPDCHKTSIIMDPFSTLTLPIPPGPQLVSRKIVFVPQQGRPVCLNVQLDALDSLKGWKNFVGEQMGGVDGWQIVAAETHNNCFWQLLNDQDDSAFESFGLLNNDVLVFYDVGPASATADSDVIVPVFHRGTGSRKRKQDAPLFGMPSFIRLSRKEAGDHEAIFSKLLRLSDNMTTRDILAPEHNSSDEHANDDSDTVVTNEDDAQSADSRIKTSSIDGEDSIVDVSMHDAQTKPAEDAEMSGSDSESDETPQHPLAGKFPANLLALFTPQVMSSKSGQMPDGRTTGLKSYPLLSSRFTSAEPSRKDSDAASLGSADNSDGFSDTDASDVESPAVTKGLGHGDSIVINWSDEGFDTLFGGSPGDSDRGAPTFEHIKTTYDHMTKRRSIKKSDTSVTLDECLDTFSKSEVLSRGDTWYCPRCKDHVQATKKFDLWRAPDIMVVQLKRFGQLRRHHSKINTVVNFPLEGLDLTGRVQGPSDGKSLQYDLVAIDNHMGSLSGGHYTAYIKDFMSGDWYHCNDSNARVVTDPQVMVASSAYLLFYRRRSERPLGNTELQEIVESFKTQPGSESGKSSRAQSPAGDGHRPGASSQNGSSSALVGAGAGPQVENDGYSTTDESDADSEDGEGMKLTGNGLGDGGQPSSSLDISQEPSWSFDHLTSAHAVSQITPGNGPVDENGLFDDDEIDSNLAVGDDDMDPDTRMTEFGDSHSALTSQSRPSFEDVSNLMDDDSDDELPVVELRVGDEDKMTSD